MNRLTRTLVLVPCAALVSGVLLGCGTMPETKKADSPREMPVKHMTKDMMEQMKTNKQEERP